jgi:hypothetical protein
MKQLKTQENTSENSLEAIEHQAMKAPLQTGNK